MDISIRYAKKQDAALLARINAESFQAAFTEIIPKNFLEEKFSYERLEERFLQELAEEMTINSIIYKGEFPVGLFTFAKSKHEKLGDSEIEIWRIYLLPQYWGQNIGKALMEWGINELQNKGFTKAVLWVLEDNKRARRFYEKFGFEHDGSIRRLQVGREIIDYRYVKELH